MSQTLLERTPVIKMNDPWSPPQLDGDANVAKSILIVEDDPGIRETLEEVFEEETIHQVLLAEDGETALEILQTAKPKVFLLDYKLPGMNGLELFERIRCMQGYEQTPIFLMSAGMLREDLTKYQLQYIRKPFDFDHLLQLVEEALVAQDQKSGIVNS